MAQKLNDALGDVLKKPIEEEKGKAPAMPPAPLMGMPGYDIRQEADNRGQYHDRRYPPNGMPYMTSDEKEEPQDKVLVAIQHHMINGDFEKASQLMQTFRGAKGGKFFTWHHMNQLMDWIRNIYKYTNMKELSRNYYNHEMARDMEIQGMDDLTKVRVRDDIVEKFVDDAKKVLDKKLKMR